MATTTFSGPVVSQNGFQTGTSASPLAVTSAQNIDAAYATTSATTGDTRLSYEKLTFTSTGSGETARFFTVVTGAGAAAGGGVSDEDIKTAANEAYHKIIKNSPRYKAYQEELKKRMTGTTVGSDLFGFMNEKTAEGISKNVEGLVSSLGLKNGAIPVQDKNGQQLTADQWDELKGNMRAIGVTYTGDPSSPMALVVRAFKDVKGKKTSGEDMIVKLPSTNIQAIAEQGMDGTQRDYMRRAAGLATSLNNVTRSFKADGVSIKANTEDPRGGWTVQTNGKEKTAYSFKDIFEFLDQNHK